MIRRDHEGLIGAAQQVEDITEHEQKKDLCTRKKRSGVQQALPPVCLCQNRSSHISAARDSPAKMQTLLYLLYICEVYVLPGLFTQEPRH